MTAITMDSEVDVKEKRRMEISVDAVANALPWAGSAIPAVMTYQNVQKLGFLPWQAAVIGLVVEGMGFVSITTVIDIYESNRAERAQALARGEQPRALFDGSFWVALGGVAVYLLAVLAVNAILDDGDIWRKLTLGLLSLFGLVGGLDVALRNTLGKRVAASSQAAGDALEHERREEERLERERREEEARKERIEAEQRAHQQRMDEERLRLEHEEKLLKIEEESRRKIEKMRADGLRQASAQSPEGGRTVAGDAPEAPGAFAESHRRWSDIPVSDYGWIADAPVGEIVKKYGLTGKDPERLARTWKAYARKANGRSEA